MSNTSRWVGALLISNLLLLGFVAWLVWQNRGRVETPGGAVVAMATTAVSPTAPALTNTPPPTATAVPTNTPTVAPSLTETQPPLPSPTATATATTLPTDTPTAVPPTPTPTAVPILEPAWLSYLNQFRAIGGVPPLQSLDSLSLGGNLHSEYMVINDAATAHRQDANNPLYSEAGDRAARSGNLFATSQLEANYIWSVNFWISAPFHLVPILDPRLRAVGFGQYNEAVGTFHMAAVLDVGMNNFADAITYPLFFPTDGAETWIVRRSLYEWPDPLGNCPGYAVPTGPAIVLQLGDGSLTPRVASHAVYQGDTPIESCIFDETTYLNSNSYAQEQGRLILDERDAIVIIPRYQLPVDQSYTVQVTANGNTYTWGFSTVRPPAQR